MFYIVPVSGQVSTQLDSRGKQVPETFLKNISVDFSEVPFVDAINEVADKGQFKLNYKEEIIPADHLVNLKLDGKPAIIVFKELLRGTNLGFIVADSVRIVIIEETPEEFGLRVKKHTVSGFVTDEESGEALIGTNIYIDELGAGCATNGYGFYSVTVPEGIYTISYSYIGYRKKEITETLYESMEINISLNKSTVSVDTVVVLEDRNKDFLESTRSGSFELVQKTIDRIPFLLGEKDVLRTMHLLPGITFGREGDTGFYVRGGNSDQNLVLLDEAPIYNAFHSFGLFSVFNTDAVKNVTMIKGSAPPKYGGRLSSVLDIQMKEGNMKDYQATLGLGLIFSRFTVQGPIIEDKSSFIFSGRRTYVDLLKVLVSEPGLDSADLYFYDLNLKVNYKISNTDRLYLSGYMGSDKLGFLDVFGMYWGNSTATLRWNHIFNNKLFLNSSLIYSQFKHETEVMPEDIGDDAVSLISRINDITVKEDFQYFINPDNTLNFGLNYVHHSFLPGNIQIQGDNDFDFVIGKRNAHEVSLYISHQHNFSRMFNIDYGLRSTVFFVEGEEDQFDIEDIDDSPILEFHEKEKKNYLRLEPRIGLSYRLTPLITLKAGYARNHQYMHMLSNSTSGTPLDVWQPSSTNVKPQRSDQYSLGYFQNLGNGYEFSIETYYRDFQNVIDFKDGANIVLRNYFESELAFGRGWAYGLEFLIRKNIGNLSGWISYTWSKSERQFDEVNNGKPFPAKYDRTHDFAIVLSYDITDRLNFSANWIYSSGYNITLPYGVYTVDNRTLEAYTDKNGYRLPAYHRLDVGFSLENALGGTWNFSVYNAYAQKNSYLIAIRNSPVNPGRKEAVSFYAFTIVPSISYTLNF